MAAKRSNGVTVFSILLIVGTFYNLMGMSNVENWNFLFQPLPEIIIQIHYFISVFIMALALISGVGILFLKDYFRKIIIFTTFFTFFSYLIEGPLLIYRNLPGFIEQQVALVAIEAPDISLNGASAVLWFFVILSYVIDFGFAICLVYFFTRPKVKEQFS